MNSRTQSLLLASFVSATLALASDATRKSAAGVSKSRRYPAVRRAALTLETNPSNLKVSRVLVIRDARGRPAYELSVVAISLDNRTTDSVQLSLNVAGAYASDPEAKYEPNLLSPDYWGHGVGREVIRPEEVCPANRDNVVVGARRVFNFRRLRVVARVLDAELGPDFCAPRECGSRAGGFVRMRLSVTVEPGASTRRRPAGFDELGWSHLDLKRCR